MRQFDHSNNPFVSDATNPYSEYYRIVVLPRLRQEERFQQEMLATRRANAPRQTGDDAVIAWLIVLVVGAVWLLCLGLFRLARFAVRSIRRKVRRR